MACALAAGIAMADTAVESANIVGYTEQSVASDTYYMVGVQFGQVGGEVAAISFNDLIQMSGVSAVSYFDMETDAAQILVNTATGYDFYYYISDAYDTDGNEVEGWADGEGNLVETADKNLGDGFWFKTATVNSGASIKVLGEVSQVKSKTVDFANGWSIIANPFPVDTELLNVITTGIPAVSYFDMETDAAQILVNTASGYDFYYYISDAYDTDGNEVEGWADGEGNACVGVQVKAGEAFWVNSACAGSLTFTH